MPSKIVWRIPTLQIAINYLSKDTSRQGGDSHLLVAALGQSLTRSKFHREWISGSQHGVTNGQSSCTIKHLKVSNELLPRDDGANQTRFFYLHVSS